MRSARRRRTSRAPLAVEQRGQYIHIMVTNPWHGEDVRRGHQVGLSNVRQRLELLHDLEARLETRVENGRFILEAKNDRRISDSAFRQQILFTINQIGSGKILNNY